MSDTFYIAGVQVIDPVTGAVQRPDLFISGGVLAPAPASLPKGARYLGAGTAVAVPGLIDLHVHLREPGNEQAETVESGSRAAAHGGFTTIVAMPNTEPACDTAAAVTRVLELGRKAGFARVLPAGCLTTGRAGREVADLAAMASAGAVAFTDDGTTPTDAAVMRKAMQKAAGLGLPVFDHAQQPGMGPGGVMHEGEFSKKLGLRGMPTAAETAVVERDIALCGETGCRVHIQHVSASESLALIRAAKARGLPVSCEVCPHHIALCDADVRADDASFKMNPPLRSARDRDALRKAVADGTIDAFATDHAPHTAADKGLGFDKAPFGIVGLETAAGVTYSELVKTGIISPARWIELWTTGPALILGLPAPSLKIGARADLALFDFGTPWKVKSAEFMSKSRNTPFEGFELYGKSGATFLGGRATWFSRVHGA